MITDIHNLYSFVQGTKINFSKTTSNLLMYFDFRFGYAQNNLYFRKIVLTLYLIHKYIFFKRINRFVIRKRC